MANLKKVAKEPFRECQIRIEGCTGDSIELAHLRMAGITGTGKKSPDLLASWACRNCHEKTESNPNRRQDFLEGVMRTQYQLINEGKIKW